MDLECVRSEAAGTCSREETRWLDFALRQAERTAPHPAPSSLLRSGAPAGYRLTLSFLESLPLFQGADRALDVRLGVTLYDEAAGCFFGPTARTAAVEYDMRRSKGRRGFHLDLGCSLFMHTRAITATHTAATVTPVHAASHADDTHAASSSVGGSSGLLAVVEVVLVERSRPGGVTTAEYSAGWCAVLLESPPGAPVTPQGHASSNGRGKGGSSGGRFAALWAAVPAPLSPAKAVAAPISSMFGCLPGGCARDHDKNDSTRLLAEAANEAGTAPLRRGIMAIQLGAGGQLCVPVFQGSPRYLLLSQMLPPEQRLPPCQLKADGAECRLHYQFEPCPEAATWVPLVPENFLVSSRDVVPGLQRRTLPIAAVNNRNSSRNSSGCGGGGFEPTLGVLRIATQLAPPRLNELHAVVLSGLSVQLTDGFLAVIRKQAAGLLYEAHGGVPVGSNGRLHLPLTDLQQSLLLRVSVHNGRGFVGPAVLCSTVTLEPVLGRRGEHRLVVGQDAPLAWLPADRFVAVVVEVLLRQPGQQPRRHGVASSGGAAVSGSNIGNGGDGSGNAAGSHQADGSRVLAWGAVMPFCCTSSTGSSSKGRGGAAAELSVAEGPRQIKLRSGPGHWLRCTPVLDWRRLIEHTNRASPPAPTLTCVLRQAPGQGIWPPPAVPAAIQLPQVDRQYQLGTTAARLSGAVTPVAVELASNGGVEGGGERDKRHTPASDVDTLLSVATNSTERHHAQRQHHHRRQHRQQQQQQLEGTNMRPDAPQQPLRGRNWGHQPQEESPGQEQEQEQERAQLLVAHSSEEAAALYSGSPTAKLAGRRGIASVFTRGTAAEAALAAAAYAVAAVERAAGVPGWCEVAERQLSSQLSVEVESELVCTEARLQLLAFEAEVAPAGVAAADVAGRLPSNLHFTFRFFDSQPTVTAPLRLSALPSNGCLEGDTRLYALTDATATETNDGRQDATSNAQPPAPPLALQLLDVPALQQQLAQLMEQGLPHTAAASLVRQQRLRAARYLAQRQLQVDVWDSASMLQVGTLQVPLYRLLLRGRPASEAVLRLRVQDPTRGLTRQDATAGSVRLCCAPPAGCFLLRLACQGRHLDLNALLDSASTNNIDLSIRGATVAGQGSGLTRGMCQSGSHLPGSPLNRPAGQRVVVRAAAALEQEEGETAVEVARQQGVSLEASSSPHELRDGIVSRAASKVRRLLHYQSLAAPAGRIVAHNDTVPGSIAARCTGSAGCRHQGSKLLRQEQRDGQDEGGQCVGARLGQPVQLEGDVDEDAAAADTEATAGELVEREMLCEVVAARERCKRDTILRQLQAQLPSCMVLCAAPGDTVAFEREFKNSSSREAWFDVSLGGNSDGDCHATPGSNDNSGINGNSDTISIIGISSTSSSSSAAAGARLSLVAEEEWPALAPATRLAGLAALHPLHSDCPPQQAQHGSSSSDGAACSGAGGVRAICSPRFKLRPHETCVLRFKLTSSLQEGVAGSNGYTPHQHSQQQQQQEQEREQKQEQCRPAGGSMLTWQSISIRRWGARAPPSSNGTASCLTYEAASGHRPASEMAASIQVAAVLLSVPVVDRTVRLYCPAGGCGAVQPVEHAVELANLPGAERLFAAAASAATASAASAAKGTTTPAAASQKLMCETSSADVAAVVQQGRVLLSCRAPPSGTVRRFLLSIHSAVGGTTGRNTGEGSGGGTSDTSQGSSSAASGSGSINIGARGRNHPDSARACLLEVWEVYMHGLPVVRLAAGVGHTASATLQLPTLADRCGGSSGGNRNRGTACCDEGKTWDQTKLVCRWRGGCGDCELQACGSRRSGTVALHFTPSVISRREMLLSVVAGGPPSASMALWGACQKEKGKQQHMAQRQQRLPCELALVQLDSSGTAVSRSFEVRLQRGQEVSKKVRYCSPYPEVRQYRVRSLTPGLLRIAPSSSAFRLEGGGATSIKMTLNAAATAVLGAANRGNNAGLPVQAAAEWQGQGHEDGEVEEVRSEALVVVESAPISRGSSESVSSQIEEIFRVMMSVD